MQDDGPGRQAIQRCISGCAAPDATGRERGQRERRCAEQLARTGSPRIAGATAAAARRVGEFIALRAAGAV
jgi:hypothetical protein